jgi:hypothetical protein
MPEGAQDQHPGILSLSRQANTEREGKNADQLFGLHSIAYFISSALSPEIT